MDYVGKEGFYQYKYLTRIFVTYKMPRKVRPTPKAYISDFTEGIEEENTAEGNTLV